MYKEICGGFLYSEADRVDDAVIMFSAYPARGTFDMLTQAEQNKLMTKFYIDEDGRGQ